MIEEVEETFGGKEDKEDEIQQPNKYSRSRRSIRQLAQLGDYRRKTLLFPIFIELSY